ncbi:MAG TPA: hypothetical protein VGZ32_22210 [Actinocrinis sp.]|jgi:hypothetical protein|uniref:hypothetical protein n=1 Tax=Actinocrinis sp. TaxID=1920516 RepID=UPI002DDD5861|nr:hypothetical protein [Actinocrinis sp.]HEV3173077.1 hypothetical protein [Actinocrinis sp.]
MLIGIIIAIVAAVLLLGAAAVGWDRHRKENLRKSFGPEYETVAQELDSKQEVDRELLRRKRQHDQLSLHPVSAADQDYYTTAWEHLQGVFLDDPALALSSAEQLVAKLLDARGYPGGDPREQLALLSVEHADALADYRRAQRISEHTRGTSAPVPTEEIRQALLAYYTLFNHLLAVPGALAAR